MHGDGARIIIEIGFCAVTVGRSTASKLSDHDLTNQI
jgi:hypothetical protein